MLFNSLTFVVFFAVILGLHYTVSSWRIQKSILLIASYLFYAAWNPPFVILLWISTLVDWYAAKALAKEEVQVKRRILLSISLGVNLGLLGFFKYGEFLLENFIELLNLFGLSYTPQKLDIILPVGISFYTFQTMSYTIDVYRKKLHPTKDFISFATFVSFFPQLVAGPIERASNLLPQILKKRDFEYEQVAQGLRLILWGMFKKIVIADSLSVYVDNIFENYSTYKRELQDYTRKNEN